jgi:hypothetical protein
MLDCRVPLRITHALMFSSFIEHRKDFGDGHFPKNGIIGKFPVAPLRGTALITERRLFGRSGVNPASLLAEPDAGT